MIGASCLNGADNDDYCAADYDQEIPTHKFSMNNFWIHDDFRSGIKYHDVAIIKLDSRVKLGYNVNTICLTEVSSKVVGNYRTT